MKKIYTFAIAAFICPSLISQELDTLVNIMKNEGTESKWRNTEIQSAPESGIMADSNTAIDIYGLPEAPEAPEIPSQVDVPEAPYPETPVVEDEDVYFEIDEGPVYVFEEERSIRNARDDNDQPRREKFEGHWAGIDLGINNYFDDDFSLQREGDSWYMDIRTGRSMSVGLNFAQYSVGIVPGHAGLVTGMGFTFNNYFFENDITLVNNDGVIETVNLAGENYVRSKLAVTYLRVPVLLEIQTGWGRNSTAFIAAGLTGSIRLDAHTKVVYQEGKEKSKDKNWDDFNLNSFRYGLTFRIGTGNTNIFLDYDITPLFTGDTDPVLYPFSLGFSATL